MHSTRRLFLSVAFLLAFLSVRAQDEKYNKLQSASFTLVGLRCEYSVNPLGIDTSTPQLEWILQPVNPALRGLYQTAYQILVASSPQLLQGDKADVWNTGKVSSDQTNRLIYAGKSLRSHQIVWWKVRAWDQVGRASAWSAVNTWTMGTLFPQDWSGAQWIGAPAHLDSAVNSTVLLRREFTIKPGVSRAILSICGLGQYEMTVNGKRVTQTLLNPGWTQYDKTCLYDTYDITSLLNKGANVIGVLLSNGMYRVAKGGRYAKFENSFGRLQAIAKVQLHDKDGSVNTLVTDHQWKAGTSPMTWSSIYGGEDWDARKVEKEWDTKDFRASAWVPVELLKGPGGGLKGITHAAPPIRTFGVYKPVSKKEIKPNVTIYDLGQQASYICRFTASGPAGSRIRITPSELLNADGTLFHNNYNGKSVSQYTLAGTGQETYTSAFFTTGCRYYQVECLPATNSTEAPHVESLEGLVVHSDNSFTGEFTCSNELFNRTFKMIQWAELSNMKSVISDCPHRERLGWLEQAHLHGPSFRYNYDMRPLVRKIIYDMHDTQQPDGLVPCIAPELTIFGPVWREAIEWGTAGVMLPWQQYEWTGDVDILRRNYAMMKKYVAYLTSKATKDIAAPGQGDWSGRWASPHTPKELIATAFYYANTDVLAKAAKLLGDTNEADRQTLLAQRISKAFNEKFFNPATQQYGTGSQCANAMALVMGLVDASHRKAVFTNLVADIENRHYENTTGEVGMRYLLRALADGGRSDVVYTMNNQTEQPGYGYQVKSGATALPETWDAHRDNSQNQFMLGHIIEWFYHDLAGIQMDATQPGFKRFVIRPHVVGDLTEVKASYYSTHGKIVSEWKRDGQKFTLHVVVPPNTTALVHIPAKESGSVTENNQPIAQAKDLKIESADDGHVLVRVASGDYSFSSRMP